MEVSINRGIQNWMVYNGILKWMMTGGTVDEKKSPRTAVSTTHDTSIKDSPELRGQFGGHKLRGILRRRRGRHLLDGGRPGTTAMGKDSAGRGMFRNA